MTPVSLEAWAIRWRLPPEALAELRGMVHAIQAPQPGDEATAEARAQSEVRLEAARKGLYLWRNNVGALQDAQGRWVRFGLANDSPQLNARLKSSDLIGFRPFVIEQRHVGLVIAQFVTREMKAPGWTFRNTPREAAQQAFIHLVLANGGDAAFATGVGTL